MLLSEKTDAQKIKELLGDFKYEECEAWKLITDKLSRTFNQNELTTLAELFTEEYPYTLNRNEKRNKQLMVKFFNSHIDEFREFINNTAYVDENGNIGGPRSEDICCYKKIIENSNT